MQERGFTSTVASNTPLLQKVWPPCVAVGEASPVEVHLELPVPTPAPATPVPKGWLLQLKGRIERQRVPIKLNTSEWYTRQMCVCVCCLCVNASHRVVPGVHATS